jgi:hypothetical protein
MSVVRLGSHKAVRVVVGFVLGQGKSLQQIKTNFYWRATKGGAQLPWKALHKGEKQENGRKE